MCVYVFAYMCVIIPIIYAFQYILGIISSDFLYISVYIIIVFITSL